MYMVQIHISQIIYVHIHGGHFRIIYPILLPKESFKISKADNGLLFSKAKYELKPFTCLDSYPS